jgi:hypothetical protein
MAYGMTPTAGGGDELSQLRNLLLTRSIGTGAQPMMVGAPGLGPTGQSPPWNGATTMPVSAPAGGMDFLSSGGRGGLPEGANDFRAGPGAPERWLRRFTRTSLYGGGRGGPLAETLFNLGQGQIPDAIQQQFETNLARSQAATTEGFGRIGARFGTDLADTLARNANEANVNLQAAAMDRALQAIGQATGVGTTAAGLQFQRREGALDRALKAFIAEMQMDPLLKILEMLGLTGV